MHIHIPVVEDNFDLVSTVIDYLETTGMVCDHTRDGQADLNPARVNRYDIILLDIVLPRINGRQICRQLREAGLQTLVPMLVALGTLQDELDGFDAGADDYPFKPFKLSGLLVRLQALSRRHGDQAQHLQVDGLVMGLDNRQASRDGTPLALSPTVWKILECLVHASSALAAHGQPERSVWGDEPPESNTLNIHMHRLRNTVDKGFATPLIHTLHSVGFQLERK